ncbi:MAG: cytochrome c oxidase assembly protein, partial [Solirubrobacteraceae bacterium]
MVAALVLAAYAIPYVLRARTLARRGRPVPAWRIWCFGAGLAVLVLAVSPPVLDLAGSRFAAHMAEHLLIADVAALLLVLGLTGPLLAPLLRVRAIDRLRGLAHPVVAFALWAANLYLWHLAWAYEGALRHELVHVLQHVLFLLLGVNLWMPLFGPFPKPAWFGNAAQLVYVVAVRLTGAVLANLFVWSGTVFYGWYGDLEDQSTAGAVMMVEESVVTVALFGWLFMKWMREGAERQEILELAGVRGIELDERRVARAVAAGRGEDLR